MVFIGQQLRNLKEFCGYIPILILFYLVARELQEELGQELVFVSLLEQVFYRQAQEIIGFQKDLKVRIELQVKGKRAYKALVEAVNSSYGKSRIVV